MTEGEKTIKNKKLLLAEDDKFISRAYNDGLKRAGFEVVLAYDGAEAIDLAHKEKPDMILLDLVMPVKNGFEVLAELKADPGFKDIPILILSNLGQESDIQKGKEAGAVDYLIKANYRMKDVVEKIKHYLGEK